MKGTTIVYGMCGSFCTFEKSLAALAKIKNEGARILPAMSFNAASMDTKFGKAEDFRNRLTALGDAPIIDTIQAAEPIGPQKIMRCIGGGALHGQHTGKACARHYRYPDYDGLQEPFAHWSAPCACCVHQ